MLMIVVFMVITCRFRNSIKIFHYPDNRQIKEKNYYGISYIYIPQIFQPNFALSILVDKSIILYVYMQLTKCRNISLECTNYIQLKHYNSIIWLTLS